VGDIKADELIVGGEIADTPYREQLEQLGVKVFPGVKEALTAAKALLKTEVPA
jgi:CRISPR-associated protein Cst2